MLAEKSPMGWNSWNTFGSNINEQLIMEMADKMVEEGYRDAGYEYVIIDDCWSLKERVDGKLTADPKLFPHGMKYLSDYIHSKGLKFGMYSCAGFLTCAGYPSSYGYEYQDAKQFAEWGVDYLKYDFCNFPASGNARNAYLTMAMALRNSGREIFFAACNWGVENPSGWMRSRGAHSYRSTGDIFDVPKSYKDIFRSQAENIENNAPGCFNDMDMLIVGMHGKGNVGLDGCSNLQYLQHFALWAFLGSPLIIGADLRKLDEENKKTLLCRGLIAIHQDEECRPAFLVNHNGEKSYIMAKILSGNRIAVGFFNLECDNDWETNLSVCFDDLGIHSESGAALRLTDAVTGEELGVYRDGYRCAVKKDECRVLVGELVHG
ncbi:MAG: glycoside hydrolase family 27 protein [Roseburia sp.]|nr:glycoside hydrolase family 27 protein [Roseburia sp.]MCM1099081.1 glycoside hydrolase family 27 protein [Ruminococcus flavefaciens]